MSATTMTSIMWFAVIVALIPLALWLLKRTPMGGAGGSGVMRSIASLPLSPSQRILTVEVGLGDDRRWLVLGVTAHSITTLHTMPPQAEAAAVNLPVVPPFAQLLAKLRPNGKAPDGR